MRMFTQFRDYGHAMVITARLAGVRHSVVARGSRNGRLPRVPVKERARARMALRTWFRTRRTIRRKAA